MSRLSKNDLQGIFWGDFCTKPALKIITKSLETSKLCGKLEILIILVKNILKIANLGTSC